MAGFIGAGKMAQALCRGFLTSGLLKPSQIMMSDPYISEVTKLKSLGVLLTQCNKQTVKNSNLVILAVKPNIVRNVLKELSPHLTKNHVIMSLAAGVNLKTLEKDLPPRTRVVRVMPNTPSLVEAGASVFSSGTNALPEDVELVKALLASVGLVEEIPEKLMDVATGVSGSGPAYIYLAIESLSDGGVKMGLPRDLSTSLAAQTVMGAAKMVIESGEHPGQLKDSVCSAGGTTIAGIAALEQNGFRSTLIQAVEAVTKRSAELSMQSEMAVEPQATNEKKQSVAQSKQQETNIVNGKRRAMSAGEK